MARQAALLTIGIVPDASYYQILGLHPQASTEAINRAWKIAARKNHPDRWAHEGHETESSANAKMAAINQAYQTLSDPTKRRTYDLENGLIPAKCTKCGAPGALRNGGGFPVALCDSCLST